MSKVRELIVQGKADFTGLVRGIEEAAQKIRTLPKAAKDAEAGISGLGDRLGKVGGKIKSGIIGQLEGQLTNIVPAGGLARDAIGTVTSTLSTLGPAGIAAGTAVAAVGGVIYQATTATLEFEKSLDSVQGELGLTGEEIDFVGEKSLELAKKQGVMAGEVATTFRDMASSIDGLKDNQEAWGAVVDNAITLSKAADMEVADAGKSIATVMNQFGLGGEQASMIIDVLANSAKFGSQSIEYVTTALEKAGGVATLAGVSFQETVSMIQILGTKFSSADVAGSKLESTLTALASQGNDSFNPAVVGMSSALDNLAKTNLGLAETKKLVGASNTATVQTLALERKEIGELTDKLGQAGTAMEMASIKTENFAGTVKVLSAMWNAVMIEIGDAAGVSSSSGLFKGLVDIIKELIIFVEDLGLGWAELFKEGSTEGEVFRGVWNAILEAVKTFIDIVKIAIFVGINQYKNLANAASWLHDKINDAFEKLNIARPIKEQVQKAIKWLEELWDKVKVFLKSSGAIVPDSWYTPEERKSKKAADDKKKRDEKIKNLSKTNEKLRKDVEELKKVNQEIAERQRKNLPESNKLKRRRAELNQEIDFRIGEYKPEQGENTKLKKSGSITSGEGSRGKTRPIKTTRSHRNTPKETVLLSGEEESYNYYQNKLQGAESEQKKLLESVKKKSAVSEEDQKALEEIRERIEGYKEIIALKERELGIGKDKVAEGEAGSLNKQISELEEKRASLRKFQGDLQKKGEISEDEVTKVKALQEEIKAQEQLISQARVRVGLEEERITAKEGSLSKLSEEVTKTKEQIDKETEGSEKQLALKSKLKSLEEEITRLQRERALSGVDSGSMAYLQEQEKFYRGLIDVYKEGSAEQLEVIERAKEYSNQIKEIQDSRDEKDPVKQEEARMASASSIAGVVDELGGLIGTLGSVDGLLDDNTKKWATWAAQTLSSVSQVLPQLAKLVARNTAVATTGAMAASSWGGIAGIIAAAATVTAIVASLPKFADGGIVKGARSVGDYQLARVNSGEMILNQRQQAGLFRIINTGRESGRFSGGTVQFQISGSNLVGVLDNYSSKTSRVL